MNYNIGYHSHQDNRLVPPDYWAEEDLHDDLDEQTIEMWALDIAQEQGESQAVYL